MQTNLDNLAKNPAITKADDIIRACVHCGFCLPTCPTYQLLNDELDSPRGRIYLIKSALEGNNFSTKSIQHLDRCLTCRSCETTCPSGVEYGKLAEIGREFVEQKRPLWQKIQRFLIRKFLTTPVLFNPIGRFFQQSKIQTPLIKPPKNAVKVLLLSGCVQPVLAPNINHSVKNVLAKLGYEVIESPKSECCGALDQHLSGADAAIIKIKNNIDNWLKVDAAAIISSASGCGLMVKDYKSMFDKDDDYYQKAQKIAAKTVDIAEFLLDADLTIFTKKPLKVAYHEPCTLQHGQKLAGLTTQVLQKIGYQIPTITDNHICCGSAGSYSILQPKIAKTLKLNKLKSLQSNTPDLIITSNIGCLMHLSSGTKTPVKHWIELLN